MATITVSNIPELITAADANDNDLLFSSRSGITNPLVVFIEIVSGTFKFNVGAVASLSSATYIAEDKVMITIGPGVKLNFKAANAAESFKISY